MLSHIPAWVFAVLVLLLFLGYCQSRPRDLAPRTVVAVAAAMAGFSLWGLVSAFGPSPAPLLCWALGMGVAVSVGPRLVAPACIDSPRRSVPVTARAAIGLKGL